MIVALGSGLDRDDVGWLVAPSDPTFLAMQAERLADPDATVSRHGADLDRDIARLRSGWRPEEPDLAEAPTILARRLHFSMSLDPARHFVGVQIRGPVSDAGGRLLSRERMTSLVIAVDATAGTWARTLNRFYRIAFDGDQSEANEDWEDIDGGWN
jgi:hypothetical protein